MHLLENTERGLYCAAGDFYIDPWRAVDFAVITHAHSDHARAGSQHYLCAEPGRQALQERLGPEAKIQAMAYGGTLTRNGVKISLHPAGHILGSAQVRVESRGEVWVVSGDYKTETEKTCAPFEPVRCHTFVTECTFGLPIYRWPRAAETFSAINSWWERHAGLEMILVNGNHDHHAGPPPHEWNIRCVEEPWILEPFVCRHKPSEKIAAGFVLAGHIHPSFRISERGGMNARCLCFYLQKNAAILPAFGNFTGTHAIRPHAGEKVFLVADGQIIDASKLVDHGWNRPRKL